MTCEQAAGERAKYFHHDVPLPPDLTTADIFNAALRTEDVVRRINAVCSEMRLPPLAQMVQANNLGGIISNIITYMFALSSAYSAHSPQAHPDLKHKEKGVPLEIKSSIRPGKGGESHNGHGGWHLIACYNMNEEDGDIRFVHIMAADLIGWEHGEKDWKHSKSTKAKGGGTGHIDTYETTPQGHAKLRDGTVYLDTDMVTNWRGWRRNSPQPTPAYSIFYRPTLDNYPKPQERKRQKKQRS